MSGGARKESGAGKKFQTYNINDTYKGGRPETRTGPNTKGHGMTSLGKIQSRRMPGPSSLPSLRTECAGNDPDINLVPSNSAGWGGGGGGGGGKEKEEKEAPTREPPAPKWGSTGENDKSGSSLPQHLQGDFPTLRDNQQQEGGRRERPVDGPPTGWGGAAPDSKQQARRGPPHQGHYPEGAQWGEQYGGPPPGQLMGPPGPYGPPPPGPHPHHHRGRGPPREGSTRGAQHQMFRPYPPHRPRTSHQHRGDPRQMLGEASQDISRPCLVKEDELKSLEVSVDEDDGGWAGHHAEVDYSKEVVFDDSDEEERDEKGRSVGSHAAWERMEDGGRRHKQPAAVLQKPGTGGREVARLQHQLSSEDQPPRHMKQGHHYAPYEQKHATRSHYGGQELHQGAWSWQQPPRRAWDRPPEIQRRTVSSDEGDWRQGDQLMQEQADSLRQRSESASSREDLERLDDFGTETPSHAREPMKSRQQLRIMMREITDSPSPDSQVKDVPVPVTAESKPHQGWSVAAQQLPPPPQKARSPVSAKEAPTEEEQLHSPVDSIATAWAADSVATKTAWDASNRGPVSMGRRLYEPEGQASMKKFSVYKRIHDKDHNGQDKKPSGSSGHEPADTPSTPGEGKVALLKGDMERPPSASEEITPVQRTEVVQAAEENAEIESGKGQKRGGAGYQKTQHGRGRMPSRGEEAKGNAKQPGDGGRQPRGDSRRSRDRRQQQQQHQDNSRHPNGDNRQPPRRTTEAKDSSHPWGGMPASDDTRRPSAEAKHEDKYPDSGEPRSSFSDSGAIQESGPSFEDSRQARGSVSNLGPSQQTQRGPRQPLSDSKQRHGESRRPQADSKQPHGDTGQPQADSRRYQADSRRPHVDSRRPQGDSKQPHGGTRQPQDDSRRSQGDSRRPHGDSRRPQGDSKQPHGDTIQPQDDSRRSQGDSRRPQGDSKQPHGDTRRPHGDSRRGQGDRQPQGDHSRGSKVAASRQPQNDLKRSQGDTRQPQPNSRGPQEEDFRETRGDSGGSRSSAPTQSDLQQSHGEARPIRGDQRQPRGDTSKAARGRRDRGRRDEPRKNQETRKQDRNDKESPAPEGRSSGGQRKEAHLQVSEDASTVQPVGSEESRKVSTASERERFDPPHTQHAKDARARPLPKDDPSRGSRAGKYDHQRPPEGRDKRQENRHGRGLPSQNTEWEGEPKESARRAARQSERRPTPAAKQEGNMAVQSRGKPRDYPAAPEKPVQMQEAQTDPVPSEMKSISVESSKQEYQQAGRGARNSSARGRGQRGDPDGNRAMPGSHDGRQRESRKPNNASTTDSRPPRREGGGRERTTRREPRHPDTVQQLKPVMWQAESAEIGKEHEGPREGLEVTITDSAALARPHDVAQMYDLSSPQVFVVDQTEGPDALLSPVDDGDFTEVVSKREKRDKKDKKEASRRPEDSYNSQQRGARKGGVHGSREEVSSSRSQAKQGSHAPLGPRGRGRQTVDGAKVTGPRGHGGGGAIVSQWEATYSKSVSGAQMSPPNPVLPETELTTTLTPLSGGQVPTTPSPSPGVIGSGILSPTSQNTSKMFGGSGGGRTHALGEVERQADSSGNYTLFSGLSGDMFHGVVAVPRSDVTQSKESRRSPAAPADPGRILGKAIQDTIQQEHPKTAQPTGTLKQPQLQQTDASLVLQTQSPRGFTEVGCVSEDQGQPQQSSSERPQQEAGRPAPGRGRGVAAGRTPGPRTTNAPEHHTGSHGSDRGTTEGQGVNPSSVSEPQSHHTQMPAPPHLPATSTSCTVQDSSDSVPQTRDSRDKLKLAEESNASRTGPPTTYQGGQKDGVREFDQSTAPEGGAQGLELNAGRSQDRGSRGKLTTEGAPSGGFTSYAGAVKSDSRPSSAASTASNEGQKLIGQLEISAPSHQEAPSGQGEMKQAGISDGDRVEDDSGPPVINDVDEVDIDLCLDLEVMGPALLQLPDVREPCGPNEGQMALVRLPSKPVAHVKPQQPVVKAGAVSALDVTFPSAVADISLPTMEALQIVPPIVLHHLHSSPAQHDDLPQTALEPAQGDVPVMVPATPEACITDSGTVSSVTQYQVNVGRSKLAVQVEKAGVRPAHHPSPIPLYLSPMDRVPSVSSLPECEQAAVEGHSEQAEDHEELLQAVEGTEDGDLDSKQLRVSASPFIPSEAASVPAKEDQVSSMGGVPEHSVQQVLGADPVTSVTDQRLLPPPDPSQPPSVPQASLHSHSSSLTQQQRLHHPVEPSPAVRMVLPTHLHAAAAYPLTVQSHPHLIQPHPHSMQQHPHSVQPHLQSVQAHPPSVQPHPPSVQPLPQQTFPLMGHVPYQLVNPLVAARAMDQQLHFGYLQSMAQPPARGPHPHPMALLYGAAPTAPQGLNLAALPPAMVHQLLMLSQQQRKAKEEGATFVSAPTVDPGFAAKMRASGQGVVPGGRPVVLPPGYMASLASGAEGHQVAASLSRHTSAAQQPQLPTVPAATAQPGVAFGSTRAHRPSHPQQKQLRSPLLPTPAATASITQSSIWSPAVQAPQQPQQQSIQTPVQCSLPSEVARHTTTN